MKPAKAATMMGAIGTAAVAVGMYIGLQWWLAIVVWLILVGNVLLPLAPNFRTHGATTFLKVVAQRLPITPVVVACTFLLLQALGFTMEVSISVALLATLPSAYLINRLATEPRLDQEEGR